MVMVGGGVGMDIGDCSVLVMGGYTELLVGRCFCSGLSLFPWLYPLI